MEIFSYQANLVVSEQINSMFDKIESEVGKLDILVNSAASFHKSPFLDISLEDWQRVMMINLQAPFLCSQKAAQLMNKTQRGENETALVVNIADLSGIYPWVGFSHHGVSKAGLIHLTKVSAKELAPSIRVNAIIPGPMLPPTNMAENSEKWQNMLQNIPLQRSGQPENIAQGIVFLANNDYMTGSVINIDGGESLIGPINHSL